jgi:hypothetical protein
MSISWWCLSRRGLIWLTVYTEANNHYQKSALRRVLSGLSSVFFRALDKEALCRAECQIKNTQQKKHSTKKLLCQHSTKKLFAESFFTLDKDKFQSTF